MMAIEGLKMTSQKITVSRACTNDRMDASARAVQAISTHKMSARGFLNALEASVAEYRSAVAAFGNRAGVSVWIQIGEHRISSDTAERILAHIAFEVADSRNNTECLTRSRTAISEEYFAAAGSYAE